MRSRKGRRKPMNFIHNVPKSFFFFFLYLRSSASGRRCRCCVLRVSTEGRESTRRQPNFTMVLSKQWIFFFFVYFHVIIPPLTNHTTMLNLSSRLFSSFVERLFALPFCKYFLVLFSPSRLGAIFVAIKYKAIVLLESGSCFQD